MSEPYNTDTLTPNPQDDDHVLLFKLAASANTLASGGGGGGGAPSGPAGGDLAGTYPNPTVPGLATKIGGDVTSVAGSVVVSTGSGNNAEATGVTIDPAASGTLIDGGNNLFAHNILAIRGSGSVNLVSSAAGVLNITNGNTDGPSAVNVGLLGAVISDAATNTVVTALTLTHATSATAAAGLGVAEVFQLPSDAGTLRGAGSVSVAWVDPTNGSESSVLKVTLFDAGTATVAASFSNQEIDLKAAALSFSGLTNDGLPHVQTGSFLVTTASGVCRILTGAP